MSTHPTTIEQIPWTEPAPTPVDTAAVALGLALSCLTYVSLWADLDQPERHSLSLAQRYVRDALTALRDTAH